MSLLLALLLAGMNNLSTKGTLKLYGSSFCCRTRTCEDTVCGATCFEDLGAALQLVTIKAKYPRIWLGGISSLYFYIQVRENISWYNFSHAGHTWQPTNTFTRWLLRFANVYCESDAKSFGSLLAQSWPRKLTLHPCTRRKRRKSLARSRDCEWLHVIENTCWKLSTANLSIRMGLFYTMLSKVELLTWWKKSASSENHSFMCTCY